MKLGAAGKLALCVLAFPAGLFSQEKPKYRCLAPFVWSIDENRAPANLFEVFLNGPFDRGDDSELAGRTAFKAGWVASNNGNQDLAMRCFRQSWEDEKNGNALVSMALHSQEVPAVAKIFAAEAKGNCSGDDWENLAAEIAKRGVLSLEEMERWCLRHPDVKELQLFLVFQILSSKEAGRLPPGWAIGAMALIGQAEDRAVSRLRVMEKSELLPDRQSLNVIAKQNPDSLSLAMRIALEKGDLSQASNFLKLHNVLDGEVYLLAAELAWLLDQKKSAEIWLDAWLHRAVFSETELLEREKKVAEIRAQWEAFLKVSADDGFDLLLKKHPGHVYAKAQQISRWMKDGRARDALFAANQDLRSQVANADRRDEITSLLSGVAIKAGWRSGWENRQAGSDFPLPPLGLESLAGPIEVTAADGKKRDLLKVKKKGNLILFYTGVGCPACQIQLQAFRRKAEAWDELGLEVLAVSSQGAKDVAVALKRTGLKFPFTFVGDPDLFAFKEFRMHDSFEDYPMHGVVVSDDDGKILWSVRSYQPYTDVEFLEKELKRNLLP